MTAFRVLLASSTLILAAACSKPADGVQHGSDDFFITVASADWKTPFTLALDDDSREACEEALSRAVCETEASTREIQSGLERVVCNANSKRHLPAMMSIVDELPERLRPSLCSVYRVFISDNIPSTAFASPITKPGSKEPAGAYIGVRKSTFLQQPTARALVTWKEQMAFGGSQEFLSNDPDLIQIDYGLKTTLTSDGLFYVLVHELGHLIDFNNAVSARGCANPARCRPRAGSFAALSWLNDRQPMTEGTFALRDLFCFYGCAKHLPAEKAKDVYESLPKSAFITTYSGMNPVEDFAEFFTWNLMIKHKSPNLRYKVPGQAVISMMPALRANPRIARKLDYVDRLWSSPTLKIRN